MKSVDSLVPEDFAKYPVWEYVSSGGILGGESTVEAVRDKIVTHLDNRIIGTHVVLHNSSLEFCALESLSPAHPVSTEHFLHLSFYRNETWFHLARYHDSDYAKRGPNQLARFLGLAVDDVFPISYDLSGIKCLNASLKGAIYKDPQHRLKEDELTRLAVRPR